jgi:hypothetical protein
MDIPKARLTEVVSASVTRASSSDPSCSFGGIFTITCVDENNQVKWEETFPNLVVNVGLQDLNTKYFTGSAYTAAWYLGLVTGPGASNTYLAANTMSSHAGWTEFANYSGERKAVTFGTATTADPSVISNSASPSVFTISGAGGTVAGAFLTTIETKSTTTGTLFSVGNFTAGDKLVTSGDTLNVTYTFSADAT